MQNPREDYVVFSAEKEREKKEQWNKMVEEVIGQTDTEERKEREGWRGKTGALSVYVESPQITHNWVFFHQLPLALSP